MEETKEIPRNNNYLERIKPLMKNIKGVCRVEKPDGSIVDMSCNMATLRGYTILEHREALTHEEIKQHRREYYRRNRETMLQKALEYYHLNRKSVLKYHRKYYAKNRGIIRKKQNAKSAIENGTARKKRTGICEMCHKPSKYVHHLIPREWTHDDSEDNLIEVCGSCHAKLHRIFDNFVLGRNIHGR